MMPLRRKLAAGFDLALIKGIEAEVNVPLQMSDFLAAVKNVSRSVGKDQLQEYALWMDQFGSV